MSKDETVTVERVRRRYEAPLAIRGPYTHEEIGALLRALVEAREEAEQWHRKAQEAEAQLAALREAVTPCLHDRNAILSGAARWGLLRRAHDDTAAAAKEHDRRVRAEALREASKALMKEAMHPEPGDEEVSAGVIRAAGRLLEMVIEVERGGAQ